MNANLIKRESFIKGQVTYWRLEIYFNETDKIADEQAGLHLN